MILTLRLRDLSAARSFFMLKDLHGELFSCYENVFGLVSVNVDDVSVEFTYDKLLLGINISCQNIKLLHGYVHISVMNVSSIFGNPSLKISLTVIHFIILNVPSNVLISHINFDFAIDFYGFIIHCKFGQLPLHIRGYSYALLSC